MHNPYIRGWINHYNHFYKTQLRPTLIRIDAYAFGRHAASSSGCAIGPKGQGWIGSAGKTRIYSLTGSYAMATAEHREPCES